MLADHKQIDKRTQFPYFIISFKSLLYITGLEREKKNRNDFKHSTRIHVVHAAATSWLDLPCLFYPLY